MQRNQTLNEYHAKRSIVAEKAVNIARCIGTKGKAQ